MSIIHRPSGIPTMLVAHNSKVNSQPSRDDNMISRFPTHVVRTVVRQHFVSVKSILSSSRSRILYQGTGEIISIGG